MKILIILLLIYYFFSPPNTTTHNSCLRCIEPLGVNYIAGTLELCMKQKQNDGNLLIYRGNPMYSWLSRQRTIFGKINLLEDERNLGFLFQVAEQCCDIFGFDDINFPYLSPSQVHFYKVIVNHLIEKCDLFYFRTSNAISFVAGSDDEELSVHSQQDIGQFLIDCVTSSQYNDDQIPCYYKLPPMSIFENNNMQLWYLPDDSNYKHIFGVVMDCELNWNGIERDYRITIARRKCPSDSVTFIFDVGCNHDIVFVNQEKKELKSLQEFTPCIMSLDISTLSSDIIRIGDGFLSHSRIKCMKFNSFDNVTSVGHHFLSECSRTTTIELRSFYNVQSIGDNFLSECYEIPTVNLSSFNNVTNVGKFFLWKCSGLKTIDLSPFSNVTRIRNYFLCKCSGLKTIDLSAFSNVTSIGSHFLFGCSGITSIDLSPLNNVTFIGGKFLRGTGIDFNAINIGKISNPVLKEKILELQK